MLKRLDFEHGRLGRGTLTIEKQAEQVSLQPGRKGRVTAVLADCLPRLQQRFLRQIVTVVAGQPSGEAAKRRLMFANEHGESGEIAPRRPPRHAQINVAVHSASVRSLSRSRSSSAAPTNSGMIARLL